MWETTGLRKRVFNMHWGGLRALPNVAHGCKRVIRRSLDWCIWYIPIACYKCDPKRCRLRMSCE